MPRTPRANSRCPNGGRTLRLKSLRLFGFKTFAEQTTIAFEPGITGIVDPNGSGKSNVVDAIRWALGEHSAKSLRSTRTEDVIFAGNERRKPLGMAEVSVTFDNADGALPIDALEVQITRRAYRTGESEYYINREHVRLRDVVDLLSGTGLGPGSYAIVSQGQIDAILTAKPSDRRGLFEEAAGIGRFLARKAESLRRLEATEQNAIRISDLLAEFEKRLPELDTQVRRAERYRKTAAKLRDYEILSYLRASTSRRTERESLQAELETNDREREASTAAIARLEGELAAIRTRIYTAELELDNTREAVTTARAQAAELETQHAASVARRSALESSANADDRERVESERQISPLTIRRLETEIVPLTAALDAGRERERKAQEALATARLALDHIFGEFRSVEAAAAAAAAADARRRAEFEAAQHEYERFERETYRLREEAHGKGEEAAALKKEIEAAGAEAAAAEARLAEGRAELERIAARVANPVAHDGRAAGAVAGGHHRIRRRPSATAHDRRARSKSRRTCPRDARHRGSPRARRTGRGRRRGRRSDQGRRKVHARPGRRFRRRALEHRRRDGRRCGERDRLSQGAGVGPRHVPAARRVGGAHRPRPAPAQSGVIGYAHTLVETEPRFAGIVAFLVGRVLVVDSLEAGVRLVRGRRPAIRSGTPSSPSTASRSSAAAQ